MLHPHGANGGIRTHVPRFRKPMHNPLCFVGMARLAGIEPATKRVETSNSFH
jgi:hypothetical protein